jgi:hypothetical protein
MVTSAWPPMNPAPPHRERHSDQPVADPADQRATSTGDGGQHREHQRLAEQHAGERGATDLQRGGLEDRHAADGRAGHPGQPVRPRQLRQRCGHRQRGQADDRGQRGAPPVDVQGGHGQQGHRGGDQPHRNGHWVQPVGAEHGEHQSGHEHRGHGSHRGTEVGRAVQRLVQDSGEHRDRPVEHREEGGDHGQPGPPPAQCHRCGGHLRHQRQRHQQRHGTAVQRRQHQPDSEYRAAGQQLGAPPVGHRQPGTHHE